MVGGTGTGRQKTGYGYDVIVGGELLLITPITLDLSAVKQINRRRAAHWLLPLVGCLPQAAWPGEPAEKSGRCGIAAD